jgi:hypothetical protein
MWQFYIILHNFTQFYTISIRNKVKLTGSYEGYTVVGIVLLKYGGEGFLERQRIFYVFSIDMLQ